MCLASWRPSVWGELATQMVPSKSALKEGHQVSAGTAPASMSARQSQSGTDLCLQNLFVHACGHFSIRCAGMQSRCQWYLWHQAPQLLCHAGGCIPVLCACRAVSQESYAYRMLEKVSRGLADVNSKLLGETSGGSLARFEPLPPKVQEVLDKSYSEADKASTSYTFTQFLNT